MSGELGIAVASRKMSATAIGCLSPCASAAARAVVSSTLAAATSSPRRFASRLLRADEQEVAGGEVEEDADACEHAERAGVQLQLHEPTPPRGARPRTSARIVNWTSSRSETSVLWLDWSRTFVESGTTESRERNRATPFCEYVEPVSVKPGGGRPPALRPRRRRRARRQVRQPDVFGQDQRDLAQHAVPGDAARERGESAPTRAPFAAASSSSLLCPSTGGRRESRRSGRESCRARPASRRRRRRRSSSSTTSSTVTSAAPPAAPKTTPRLASKLALTSSRGRRLTARMD